jgi:hypothetical protein
MLDVRTCSVGGRFVCGALWMVALAVGLGAGLGACASRPTAEFAAYKEAFDAAREAGEAVLLDHASAERAFAESRAAPAEAADPEREFDFDAASIAAEGGAPDGVTVRFRAWQVVAEYNDALTALIEGRPQAEVAGEVGGLLESLRSFPVSAVADAAEGLTPFGGLIKSVLGQVQRAYEAEQFREAVLAGSELIPGFVALSIADAQDFYDMRRGLRDRARDPLLDSIRSDAQLFRATVGGIVVRRADGGDVGGGQNVAEFVERFNLLLVEVRAPTRDVGVGLGEEVLAMGLSAEEAGSLGVIVDRARGRAGMANALDAELLAYREVLVAYVRMLQRLDGATATLRTAAERRVFTLAPAEEIFRAALETRRALAHYEEVGNR